MSDFPILPAAIGVVSGGLLFAVGFVLGRRGRNPRLPLMEDAERVRMLNLLSQLEAWTTRYSGDVSNYQTQLMRINDSLLGSMPTSVPGGDGGQNRFLTLLSEVIDSNRSLADRLQVAESQLSEQTQQIQGYLSEARTDGLTGLANRRALDSKLDESFERYRAGGASFCVALIDIDKFKSINDDHGHGVGDEVLSGVARLLSEDLETPDMVARYGGEEFAVVMPGPLKVAADQINRARRVIEGAEFGPGKPINVTISAGVSEPRQDAVVASVLRRADEALYAAKNRGRNRTYYHDGDKPTLVGAPETIASD